MDEKTKGDASPEEIISGLRSQVAELKLEKKAFESNEKTFKALVESAVGKIGQDFFNIIVAKLSEWLNTECVIIGRVVDYNKVLAIPMYLDGRIVEDYSYDLKGTPCDLAIKRSFCTYPENIAELFPEDLDLVKIGAVGYVGTALYNKFGEPDGILCALSRKRLELPPQAEDILKIIGARIAAEIERNRLDRALHELNASKDKFISILAHDLNSPFHSLLGLSDLLLDNLRVFDLEKIESMIRMIRNVSHQTHELLEEILMWANSQSDRISFSPQRIDFTESLAEVTEGLKDVASSKRISINSTVKDAISLKADLNMFKTILRNLISNAIKFSNPGGRIDIGAEIVEAMGVITVADDGVGIEKEDIPKLWEITAHFSKKGTSEETGTGFGLILCKEFVDRHGGSMWAESEPGRGSTFRFTLPAYFG